MAKLELRNLRKQFGDFIAVERLDLEVGAGETVALLGPSGCGKSTTLNMIVGLEQPTSGDILIDGGSILDVPPGKRNIGLVFQDYAVFTHMSVAQNLAFGLRMKGTARRRIEQDVRKVAELLHLQDHLNASISELGASQVQRVAIGRTLVTNPAILLLDEPLSNLEVTLRNQMRKELRRIQHETGQTIIYVTHDQIEALSLAHRIAVMDQGRLQQYDTAFNVYHYPDNTFVGSFLGNPPMNFMSGTVHRVDGRLVVQSDDAIFPLPARLGESSLREGQPLRLGLRPEAVSVVASGEERAFAALVQMLEPQGPETVVTARWGEATLKLVVPTGHALREGEQLWLRPELEMLALFDPSSGARLFDGRNAT